MYHRQTVKIIAFIVATFWRPEDVAVNFYWIKHDDDDEVRLGLSKFSIPILRFLTALYIIYITIINILDLLVLKDSQF